MDNLLSGNQQNDRLDCYDDMASILTDCSSTERAIQVTSSQRNWYGDGMNDYYMLKQADEGFLVMKQDSSISRSLKGKDLEGLKLV